MSKSPYSYAGGTEMMGMRSSTPLLARLQPVTVARSSSGQSRNIYPRLEWREIETRAPKTLLDYTLNEHACYFVLAVGR